MVGFENLGGQGSKKLFEEVWELDLLVEVTWVILRLVVLP